ncbi:MAG: DNA polymerase III subunit delta [Alloprevotella sp.]|nr:DNA polymerase III subunit delta [Alloprevotella sp.]
MFERVLGQEQIKQQLRQQIAAGRLPHALLFCGTPGGGQFPMALAVASALLGGGVMVERFVHPDLHFVFPVVRQKSQSGEPSSDQYIQPWREMLSEDIYFDLPEWLERMGVENQQAIIGVGESAQILRKLSLRSSQGGYKVMIIWLPELMNQEAANKLLKILEEPPQQTVFILVSERPERLLSTILSRTQQVEFPPLPEGVMAEALQRERGVGEEDARRIARLSEGSYVRALRTLQADAQSSLYFDMFVSFMRLTYQRKVRELGAWAEQLAGWGRERQKNFLAYSQHLVRENFIYNFRQQKLSYETQEEAQFSQNFARFINERNVYGIMGQFSDAERDIEGNVNARMVFFDLALQMAVLIRQ